MALYKGGDGSSKEKAIIIIGAENEFEGVEAEHNEIEKRFGYFEIESQLFFDEADKKYDCLNIISVTEQKKEVWFDITDFYGKELEE